MDQSEPQSAELSCRSYFDPEAGDSSEETFSASLESVPDPARFVVDGAPDAGSHQEKSIASQCSGEITVCGALANTSEGLDERTTAGESAHSNPTKASSSVHPDWREQVSAKISKYKSSGQHKVRYPSLQLQFDETRWRNEDLENGPAKSAASFSQALAAEIDAMKPAPVAEIDRPRVSLEATARVLEFPRPASPAFDPDELAEPVLDRPRIIEAPELLPAPPAMGGILIEPVPVAEPEKRAGFDVPLQPAPLSHRLWAGVVDALLLAIAAAAFGYVFVRMTGVIPAPRVAAECAFALIACLWPAYQYAFLVSCGSTPGLRLAKLEVRRFDGSPACRRLRRWRVLASFLSAISLGLGYGWCFLDEDQLSWHDRITRTHLAPATARVSRPDMLNC